MTVRWLQAGVVEPWMGFSRWLTHGVLRARVGAAPGTATYSPVPRSVLYVAASALPYHISGYATRTHEIARALQASGATLHMLTRPGYPWDRADRCTQPVGKQLVGVHTQVQGIDYMHIPRPLNNWPVVFYALLASRAIARMASARRVAAIHAASNHVNALPALLAARHLGIPFQYEMRGLWELTRISRMPEFEGTQAYRQGLQLEGLVARSADRLFVISRQLGRYMAEHYGVDTARMGLLPNCVDPDRFAPGDPASVVPGLLGYAGSIIGYEGLDTLIDAMHKLVTARQLVSLAIIGDGEARPALQNQVQRLGLHKHVHFLGRVSPDVARVQLARCAIVCIPRKPYTVCKIVPPIKLVEALAMGKPVVVPDLPVFREELGNNPPGWFFKAGDADDLARVLRHATGDAAALAAAGAAARTFACTQRAWRDFVGQISVDQGFTMGINAQ